MTDNEMEKRKENIHQRGWTNHEKPITSAQKAESKRQKHLFSIKREEKKSNLQQDYQFWAEIEV